MMYELFQEFKNIAEWERAMEELDFPTKRLTKKAPQPCQACTIPDHAMVVTYIRCSNKECLKVARVCPLQLKEIKCSKAVKILSNNKSHASQNLKNDQRGKLKFYQILDFNVFPI